MIVVSDTSPINYLILIDKIDVLRELFVSVVIPDAVRAELSANGSPAVVKKWLSADPSPSWIDVKSPRTKTTTLALGAGETEAITLANELKADLVLIDDRKARHAAIDCGLAVAGTINVLEAGSKRGLVDLTDAFRSLTKTNFRIAPKLLVEILKRNSQITSR